MRRFKFRAWHKDLNKMIHFNLRDLCDHKGEYPFDDLHEYNQLDSQVITMQYLGEDCRDHNGIELCEGDIVECPDNDKHIIKYDQGEFIITNIDDWYCWNDLRKIGNIHQNPELLNEKI